MGGRAMPAIAGPARAQHGAAGTVVVALAVAGIATAVGTYLLRYGLSDLMVNRDAVRSWLSGDGLYAYRSPDTNLGSAISPVAAFLLAPAALLPVRLSGWLLGLAGVAALGLALIALAGPVARRYGKRRWPAVLVAMAAALTLQPIRAAIGLGDLDLLVFGLVIADVVALRRSAWACSRAAWWPGHVSSERPPAHLLRRGWSSGAWAGIGIGIATALAIGPGVFIAYLAVTRQWRAALTASGTAAALACGALLTAPQETAGWFSDVLWRLDRTGGVERVDNQSLAGVLARLYDSATTPVLLWLSFALLLVAVGMIRARSAHADGDEIAAFTLIGLTGAIVGPVSESHKLVWVAPAILILTDAAARQRVADRRARFGRNDRFLGAGWAAAAVVTFAVFAVAPVWTLSGNAYALGLILLVNALPWRPGVAPAFPINRWLRPAGRRPIPAARPPTGS
jgi:alpha-1,2-mannosyltransferase